MDDLQRDVIVSNILIGDGHIEISFFEKRDQAERAGLLKNIVLDRARYANLIDEILDTAVDIVDAGLLEIRSPAESLDPRKRLSTPQEPSED